MASCSVAVEVADVVEEAAAVVAVVAEAEDGRNLNSNLLMELVLF